MKKIYGYARISKDEDKKNYGSIETQKNLIQSLSERAEKIHNKQVTPDVDNMLKVTTDGIKIGLDQRLINPLLPDEPNTKINMCVNNVIDIWKQILTFDRS